MKNFPTKKLKIVELTLYNTSKNVFGPKEEFLKIILPNSPFLRKLNLTIPKKSDYFILNKIGENCSNGYLKVLKLDFIEIMDKTVRGLGIIFNKCKNLEDIEIVNCKIEAKDLMDMIEKCKHLRKFSLKHCEIVGLDVERRMLHFGNNLSELTVIEGQFMTFVTTTLMQMMGQCFNSLQKLSFQNFDKAIFGGEFPFCALESITLDCTDVESIMMKKILEKNSNTLTSLTLNKMKNFTGTFLKIIATLPFLKHFHADIDYNQKDSMENWLGALCGGCQSLEKLIIHSNLYNMNTKDLIIISTEDNNKFMNRLKYLKIAQSDVGDLHAILHHCPNLEHLNIEAYGISNDSRIFEAVTGNCHNLLSIKLTKDILGETETLWCSKGICENVTKLKFTAYSNNIFGGLADVVLFTLCFPNVQIVKHNFESVMDIDISDEFKCENLSISEVVSAFIKMIKTNFSEVIKNRLDVDDVSKSLLSVKMNDFLEKRVIRMLMKMQQLDLVCRVIISKFQEIFLSYSKDNVLCMHPIFFVLWKKWVDVMYNCNDDIPDLIEGYNNFPIIRPVGNDETISTIGYESDKE